MNLINDIRLEPQESYIVNLYIGSDDPSNKPVVNIRSRKGQTSQNQIKDMELSQEISIISSDFETTEDIKDATQWVRIDIPGKTEAPFFIKGIEIWQQ